MTDSPDRPRNLRRGAMSLLGGQWGKYLLQILSFVVLARLLSPSDFGLVTMVTAVLGLATVLGDMGLSMAALQRESLTQGEKSNLFWLNVLTGLIATILAAAASPVLAVFYQRSEVLWIGLAISVTFLLNGASVQSKVEMNRRGRFGALASIDLGSQAVAFASAVILALAGAGYWALVVQSVAAALVGSVWAMAQGKWIPSRWSSTDPVKPFLRFGLSTLALQAVNYVSVNVANVVLGRTMSSAAVGIYGRATQLVSLPVQQLASPLTRISLPYLADKSRVSQNALLSAAVTIQHVLVVALLGALSLLAATADPLVPLLLGSDWAPAVPLVQILAVGGAFQALGYLYYWLFLSTARTASLLASELPGRIFLMVLVLVAWPFGLAAVAWSFSIAQMIIWLTGTLFFVHRTGVAARVLVRAAAPTTLLYAAAASAAILVGQLVLIDSSVLRVIISATVWLAACGLGFTLVPSCRRAILSAAAVIKNRKSA
ncbi:PST family polysaccharide transporter [Microbacterium sp. 1154]|uniref:lipopolysaccharide biosynthesis protein n=1 Tax=Microbacterium sp. 1154 TaxID=2817733 RepID=UPI00286305AD|nr:lipopolysaccharide biosynthesis protein [Microbacterium sp. 1154]MDR6691210.1 PST family polysaccharide transporter [Microbacterium sp. 1154]